MCKERHWNNERLLLNCEVVDNAKGIIYDAEKVYLTDNMPMVILEKP